MIRVLFIIVAVVAAIMAVLLKQPVLFVAAGLALLVSIILIVQQVQKRRSSYKHASNTYAQQKPADEDLSSLGILEIKPRQKGAVRDQEIEDAVVTAEETLAKPAEKPAEKPAGAQAPAATPAEKPVEKTPEKAAEKVEEKAKSNVPESNGTRASAPITLTIKEKAQTVRAFVDETASEHYREALVPYLQSLRSAVDATTVCLLKQSDDAIHHHIVAIVSLNAYARSGGDFSSKVPLVQTVDNRAPAAIRKVSDADLPASGLGYYREAIAVKEVAVAPVPRPASDETYVLLADVMQEGGLDTNRRRTLIGHFARLLGAVLESGDVADIPEAYDYLRPRKEIISEEISRARKKKVPLALALVHLNEAERVADHGEGLVKATEKALASRIRQTARHARVERFGELTFGVFFQAPGSDVESWALSLQRELQENVGELQGGISIGIAMLQDRHNDADAFRRDATEALREAYESGTCTIVE